MGFGRWASWIFGDSRERVSCNLCRCDIPPGDIDKGLAVMIARRQYCKGCVEEITRRAQHRNLPGLALSADLGSSSTIFLG